MSFNINKIVLIIDIIKDFLSSNKYKPMEIGVVTPFRQQANLITENIGNHFGADVGRYLLADTAHKFQGDEREIMIFSLVAGESIKETTYSWMQEGKSKNLIKGYSKIRKLSQREKKSLNILCKGAALRYLLTRTYDYLNTPKSAIIKIKDPKEYIQKLKVHNTLSNFKNYFN